MKKIAVRFTSVLLAIIFMFAGAISVMATDSTENEAPAPDSESTGHVLVMKSESLSVAKRKTIQMTASVSNVETQPVFTWTSSDESIATVDSNGKVKGVDTGKAIIFVTAEVEGETLNGEFAINVVTDNNIVKDLLESQQILSYQYSYIDDYYYTNDKEAWQYNFGFGKIYDYAAPYFLLEYDYIRIFFTYGGKDWMLQMWKGQYGMLFYGGEIGIYTRTHDADRAPEWTFYHCPDESDWLMMEMTLYHENLKGEYVREFTREYDKYWWCTGFKNGHLRQQEPADELRLEGRVTFKDAEMARLVADGFIECGFIASETMEGMDLDQIYVDGADLYFRWQNISEAESTMAIKVIGGGLTALMMLPFYPLIAPLLNGFLAIVALIYIIA